MLNPLILPKACFSDTPLPSLCPAGFTALMAACKAGAAQAVTALLDGGADVNSADESGVTALMLAAGSSEVSFTSMAARDGARYRRCQVRAAAQVLTTAALTGGPDGGRWRWRRSSWRGAPL